MNSNTYTVSINDVIRHGSGDGYIQVDGFDGSTWMVTDMEHDEFDKLVPAGLSHVMSMHDMLRCVKAETGHVYSRVTLDTSDLPPIFTADSFGSDCPSNWEEITDALNTIVNEQGIYFDHAMTDALWADFCRGELEGVPAPVED